MCVITLAAASTVETNSTASLRDRPRNNHINAPNTGKMYVQYKRISISDLLDHETAIGKAKVKDTNDELPSPVLKSGLSTPVTTMPSPPSTVPSAVSSYYSSPRTATPSPNSVVKRPQGRPITQKLVGMFTIYDCKEDLILDLIRTECLELLQGPSIPIVKRPNTSFLQKIIDLKEPTIYDQLKAQFQTNDTLQFIKLIRDHKGKLLRLETVPCSESQVNIDFIKRNVCYPRYKSNMKFYLIRSNSLQKKFIYYHDRATFERERHLIDFNIEVWVR